MDRRLEVFHHLCEASHFLLHYPFITLSFLKQLAHFLLHLEHLWLKINKQIHMFLRKQSPSQIIQFIKTLNKKNSVPACANTSNMNDNTVNQYINQYFSGSNTVWLAFSICFCLSFTRQSISAWWEACRDSSCLRKASSTLWSLSTAALKKNKVVNVYYHILYILHWPN